MRHRIWALVLVLLLMCRVTWSTRTERSLDRSALKQAERHILAMFGLDSRPIPSKTNKTVSSYVKALYERQSKTRSPDTIRCFKGRDIGLKNGCDPFRVKYQFDLAGVPDSEELWAAELVLYREGEAAELRPSLHRVQVHDIMQPATQESDSRMRLLDVKIFQGTLSGSWETFDVLPAVRRWLEDPSQNFGLFVELGSSLKRDGLQSVRLKRNIDEDQEEWSQYEPLLVLYSRDPNAKPASVLSRTKRSSSTSSTRGKHRRKGRKDNCRRHELYVDFNDVGWDDWIIAPPGFYAYFCHGDCPFPLPDHLNATNHAIVQTLVNSANPAAVPRACCVPSELSSISMLYKDQNDNVVLHTYRDMVVEGCGCR